MIFRFVPVAIYLVALALTAATAGAQTEYKEFKRSASLDTLFTLKGDRNGHLTVGSPRLSGPVRTLVPPVDSLPVDSLLTLPNGITFYTDRITVGDSVLRYDEIVDIRIESRNDTTVFVFLTSPDTTRSITRLRQGNIIRAFSPVHVDSQQFVRGGIFTVTGDITVAGEVNRDVVSLFGRIATTATGVVRGGTAAMFGHLDVSKGSTVYGSMLSPRQKRLRRFQLWSRDRELTVDPDIRYDRVDGLTLFLGLAFRDHDSLLPSVWASGGYAFESERGRYKFGIEQTIAKSRSLVIGGEAYRKLSSDDNWILNDYENLAYVILAREDFKDYYEAEGSRLYARIRPFERVSLGVEFRSDQTHWLDAHPRLWAVFGGHKRFRDNFSTVDPVFRSAGMAEIESTTVAGLKFSADFNTRATSGAYDSSAWRVDAWLEWSNEDFGSDFDFRRYTIGVTRYQKIQKESMLMLKARYGGSDGYLPMHRRFYMGGLGSWQGYRHKEYVGGRFWMTSAEYRIVIPGSDIALSTFWDCGQIAFDAPLDNRVDVKNSIGMAGYLGSSVRLSVAKRLDRSDDDDPRFYVRLAHHF